MDILKQIKEDLKEDYFSAKMEELFAGLNDAGKAKLLGYMKLVAEGIKKDPAFLRDKTIGG